MTTAALYVLGWRTPERNAFLKPEPAMIPVGNPSPEVDAYVKRDAHAAALAARDAALLAALKVERDRAKAVETLADAIAELEHQLAVETDCHTQASYANTQKRERIASLEVQLAQRDARIQALEGSVRGLEAAMRVAPAEVARDAARYRYIRENRIDKERFAIVYMNYGDVSAEYWTDKADRAIDAALAAAADSGGGEK